MKVLFTGIQPTGDLHIGNYFGAVKNWVSLQQQYISYICIVDLHALTISYDTKEMQKMIFNLAAGLFACGIDIKKTILFVQSHVPGHADLTWIFNTITPVAELERMTQFKNKARQNKKNINAGILNYPVLQAADILLYKGNVVPVGEDQVQHVEFTREIARYFNKRYGHTFPECEALLTTTPRIMGLDGEQKMSKSKGNVIGLMESKEEIWEKLSKAKTDPARIRRTDPGNPQKCNIFSYHQLFTPEAEKAEIDKGCRTAGIGCIDCKKILLKNMMIVLDPIREKYYQFQSNPQMIDSILDENAKKCTIVAKETILQVKEKMGLKVIWKIST